QNKGCLSREWHSLWSWLKLIRSPRAAVDMRTGIEISPNVRWPCQHSFGKQARDSARGYRLAAHASSNQGESSAGGLLVSLMLACRGGEIPGPWNSLG